MEQVRAHALPVVLGAALIGVVALGAPANALEVEPDPGVAGFAITAPADGAFDGDGTVTVTGTKAADATVEVRASTGGDQACVVGSGSVEWACEFVLPSGEAVVTAIELPADGSDPVQASVQLRVLTAPGIGGVDPQLTTGTITGTGFPGAGIRVIGSGPTSFDVGCGVVLGGGVWTCVLPVTESGTYAVEVRQSWPGSPGEESAPGYRTLLVDRDPPGLPVIASPAAGETVQSPFTINGTGEDGGRVDVFLDGVLVCTATVSGGAWSCTASGVDGTRNLQAIQWDPAGNPSGSTGTRMITVGPPAVPQEPEESEGPLPPDDSSEGSVPPPVPPTSPGATPPPSSAGPEFLPPPIGGRSGVGPLETWGLPTGYGAAIPAPAVLGLEFGEGGWVSPVVVAAGFVLLVALPLRLLRTPVLADRLRRPAVRIAGRNRGRMPEPQPTRPLMIGAGALVVAGGLAAIAGGIQAEARFVRLALAALIAILLLNAVALLAARIAGAELARIQPALLAAAAVLALGSRALGVQPPVVFAIVLIGSATALAGRVAATGIAAPWAVGVTAWLLHVEGEGFAAALAGEVLAVLVVAGLGSAVVLALPVGRLPGQVLLERSPVGWAALTMLVTTTAAAVLVRDAAVDLWWIPALATAFAAVVTASWLWLTYVREPAPE